MAKDYVSVMDPAYVPPDDRRMATLGALRGLLDISPVGAGDLLHNTIAGQSRMTMPGMVAGLLGVPQTPSPGEALSSLLGIGGEGPAYEAGRSVGNAIPLSMLRFFRPAARGKMMSESASKSPSIFDPKPLPQRPFDHDYPHGTAGGDDAGRVAFDIEGRPLTARYIAGRRVVGGADEAIDRRGVSDLGSLLGATSSRVPGSLIAGDAGRYIRSATPDGEVARKIFINERLDPDRAGRVQAHETGHLVDDLVQHVIGSGGSRIPAGGLKKELQRIYEDLNTAGHFKPGRGATPKTFGYGADQIDAELMAEAVRSYMADPNYLKTVAPKTAARIREYVNANPNLNRVVQFNSISGAALGGSLLSPDSRE